MNNKTPSSYKVFINSITYNHAPYIEETMNGFCMQQTTFPFVAVIIDDASSDGEPEVINHYLQKHFDLDNKAVVLHEETDDYVLTFARHITNQNCFFAVYLLKYNFWQLNKSKNSMFERWSSQASYVSFCEGDDYWTKPYKLQKQVDFLESHLEYSMCFHRVDVKVEGDRLEKTDNVFDFLKEGEYTKEDQLRIRRIVPTCSILMRRDVAMRIPSHPKFTIGDVVVVATALTYGRMWCMGDVMGVYRLVANGWTSMSDLKMCKSMFSHNQGMIESFDWYQCNEGYEIFNFWSFSLLKLLKDSGNYSEFEAVAKEYKKFMGVNNLNKFWYFYYVRKLRQLLRTIFGNRITQIGKLLIDREH